MTGESTRFPMVMRFYPVQSSDICQESAGSILVRGGVLIWFLPPLTYRVCRYYKTETAKLYQDLSGFLFRKQDQLLSFYAFVIFINFCIILCTLSTLIFTFINSIISIKLFWTFCDGGSDMAKPESAPKPKHFDRLAGAFLFYNTTI